MPAVALKIQRRRSPRSGINEIGINKAVQRAGPCDSIVALQEAFLFEGHVCMAYEKHGRSLDDEICERCLTPARALAVTRQILDALARLHAAGFTHTDLKPANILYDRRTGVAKLADLGNADSELIQGTSLCTREYTPPEVLLGAPLSPAIDHWALGCVVFEMLAGETLFDPRTMAAAKYKEFYFEEERSSGWSEPKPEAVAADRAEEAAEQYAPGAIIAGKYRLTEELGQGRFGTVWSAETIAGHPLDGSYETLSQHCRDHEKSRGSRTEAERSARTWKKQKGANDMRDLALNYEHLLLIDRLCGPIPPALILTGKFRNSFFTSEGAFRHPDPGDPMTIAGHLATHAPRLKPADISRFSHLISILCHLDPSRRTAIDPALLRDKPPATIARTRRIGVTS